MFSINITNVTTLGDIGGVQYFQMFLTDYVPYITLYMVGTIVGVIGDCIFIYLYQKKGLGFNIFFYF